MRRALLILVVACCASAQAQSWCAPGAEWIYGFGNQQASGVTHARYSGDSLIGGFNAQRIDQTIHAYQPNPPFGQPFTQELDPLFTRYEDGVVHIWDIASSTYDTLIWLGAVPGQHWLLHHQEGFGRFDVLDTGTSIVQGIPLHFLIVQNDVLFDVDTIRERVGSDISYINPIESFVIDWTTRGLHCYRDDAIEEFSGNQSPVACDFTLASPVRRATTVIPFPNPGTNHFTLSFPPGAHTITLIAATGREVLHQRATEQRPVIGTAHLAPGLYLVRVDDHAPLRWVKE